VNQFSKRCVIKGVSFFADKIDGEAINSGSVFIEEQLDEKTGRSKGFRTVEYKCPDSEIPKRLISNTFPVEAEVVFELTTTKRAQTVTIADVRVGAKGPQPAPLPRAA
jgi:hypothetical protein